MSVSGRAALALAASVLVSVSSPAWSADQDVATEMASEAGFCAVDGQTPAALRAEPEAAAREFLDEALGFQPEDAYDKLYSSLKQVLSKPEFLKVLEPLRNEGPLTRPKLEHFYRIVLHNRTGGTGGKAMCFEDEGASARRVYLSQASTPEQAHLVFTSSSPDYHWTIDLWLINERTGWSVLGISSNPDAVLGHDAADLLARGQAEEGKGHTFNATVLYMEALSLYNRGQSMQLERQSDLLRNLGAFRTAPELSGQPPYRWYWGGQDVFNIHSIRFDPWHERMAAYIVQTPAGFDGMDLKKADELNRKLIDAFVKAHPEWGDALDALVAIVVTADGRPFQTVYDKDKGYVTPAPTPTAPPAK